MNQPHECEPVREQLALYLYGELSFDQEETVDAHLDTCDGCRKALVSQREWHESIDSVGVEASPALLWTCRENLHERLALESPPAAASRASLWTRFTDAITIRPGAGWSAGWWKPLGATALLAAGFLAGHLAPFSGGGAFAMLGLAGPEASRVRFVSPSSNGGVQIVLDETRQRTVTGALDDERIRALLLAAAKDPTDAGLRLDTLSILKTESSDADVRSLLLQALEQDQNAGVRFKALEGLRPYAQDQEVQNALARVLLMDANPGMRTQAIDMLTANPNTDRHVVGALQELMGRESNGYIRERGQQLLEAVKASAEIY